MVLAIITLAFSGHHNARQIVDSLFIMIWGARLSGFLLFRIIKTGKDDRFDDKRDKFFPFLGFWVFQMLWVWTVSLPVTILNSPNVTRYRQPNFGTGRDIAGVILFTIGFLMESVSDIQKFQFRSKPENKGKVCDVGLFVWTRHPNYFGEIIIQFCKQRSFSVQDCTDNVSYLHDCRIARSIRIRPWRGVQCSLRIDPRRLLLDHSAHVRVWLTITRAPWSEEALRKWQPLEVVLSIYKTHKHPDTLSSPNLRQDTHNFEEDDFLGIPFVRL